jgi:phospholipase C
VEAGKYLRDRWDTDLDKGAYDLWVLGPNGFHRQFSGDVDAQLNKRNINPEVGVYYDCNGHELSLILINASTIACTFKVASNAYGNKSPREFRVRAGGIEQHGWSLRDHGDWYDFSVTVEDVSGYLRRLAGRMESGRHGVSDPAFGA